MSNEAEGSPAGDQTKVSFEKDIKPLFRPMDVECMRSRGLFLLDYDSVKGMADSVLFMLGPDGSPRMPYGGPYWSQAALDLFKKWMDDGYEK